jgi:signal transduction histidine kinase
VRFFKVPSGLGLSIVKKIVDNYHGEIWIESELGIATFNKVK